MNNKSKISSLVLIETSPNHRQNMGVCSLYDESVIAIKAKVL